MRKDTHSYLYHVVSLFGPECIQRFKREGGESYFGIWWVQSKDFMWSLKFCGDGRQVLQESRTPEERVPVQTFKSKL